MTFNANMISIATRVLGTSVAGSRSQVGAGQPDGAHSSHATSYVASFLGATDVLLNGSSSTALAGNPLTSLLHSGVSSLAGSLGISLPNDRIPLDRSSTIQLATVTAQRQFVADQLRSAQNAASTGDQAAQLQVAQLTKQAAALDARSLLLTADGSEAHAAEVRTKYLAQYPEAAGFEQLLTPGHDVLADLAHASTPAARTALSAKLTTALGVGVAELDRLRAQIQYYQYLVTTGQITPEQQQQLDGLTKQYAGTTQQLEIVRRAHDAFLADNSTKLTQLTVKRDATEKQVGRLIEANARLTGKSMVDGRAIDWSKLTDEQKVAELRGSVETVRTLNEQVVEKSDFSGWKPIEQARTDNWDTYASDWVLHHDEWDSQRDAFEQRAAQRREDARREEQRYEERRADEKYAERRSAERADDARRADEAWIQSAVQRHAEYEQQDFQSFMAALDQTHAEMRARAMAQPTAS